jgi:UDP-N-acetylmuramoyl-tripeptide--D-alanyl-D-alanine ligase
MITAVRALVETYPAKKKVLVVGSMLELGAESEKYHFHLGVELAHFALEHVFLVGAETKSIFEGATSAGASGKKFTLCADVEAAADAVKKIVTPETVVLFKGSRGIQLEKAVDMLVAR